MLSAYQELNEKLKREKEQRLLELAAKEMETEEVVQKELKNAESF